MHLQPTEEQIREQYRGYRAKHLECMATARPDLVERVKIYQAQRDEEDTRNFGSPENAYVHRRLVNPPRKELLADELLSACPNLKEAYGEVLLAFQRYQILLYKVAIPQHLQIPTLEVDAILGDIYGDVYPAGIWSEPK
jgi:hypothetical protein